MAFIDTFKTSEADIIQNKKDGVIYVADFPQGSGKYVSIAEEGVEFHLSLNPPRYASEEEVGLIIDYTKIPKKIEEKTQKQIKAKDDNDTPEEK